MHDVRQVLSDPVVAHMRKDAAKIRADQSIADALTYIREHEIGGAENELAPRSSIPCLVLHPHTHPATEAEAHQAPRAVGEHGRGRGTADAGMQDQHHRGEHDRKQRHHAGHPAQRARRSGRAVRVTGRGRIRCRSASKSISR